MTEPKLPNGFHAHVYFNADQATEAEKLCTDVSTRFSLKMGRVHKTSVGPHPRGSCQITVPFHKWAETLRWLMMNRGDFTVFVHPMTGDDWIDHTQGVMWLGQSEDLKLEIFQNS